MHFVVDCDINTCPDVTRSTEELNGVSEEPVESAAAIPARAPKKAKVAAAKLTRTLAVDVGGTGIKAMILDEGGKPLGDRKKIATPRNATPKKVMAVILELASEVGDFERVSVGFPGVIKEGLVYTAPNLGKGWASFPLEKQLADRLKHPVRLANDADVQGLGCATGKGDELVITLGTGFGSVLFVNGHRIHLELGHHPFHKGKTYEDELGHKALKKKGKKKWNKMLREAIGDLAQTFNYDRLYIGGGSAAEISFKLPKNVFAVSNEDGILGGIKLWTEDAARKPATRYTKPKPKVKAKAPVSKPVENSLPAVDADTNTATST
jgi:polyphosphate glucokinase